ncbi:hypothetical protein SY2F82_15910 [Streptomyces sp. Y2F8-2]|nr:hypothetical protein SY2F82_15910 [Streptomyces sp. Y2F8-2]
MLYHEPAVSLRWKETGSGPAPTGAPPPLEVGAGDVAVLLEDGDGVGDALPLGVGEAVGDAVALEVGEGEELLPPTTTVPCMSGWKRQW